MEKSIIVVSFYIPQVVSILGISWILMFIASGVDYVPIWWTAVVANSLQGVHIFIAFGFNSRVRNLWKKSLMEGNIKNGIIPPSLK